MKLFLNGTILLGFFLVLNYVLFYSVISLLIETQLRFTNVLVPFVISLSLFLGMIKGYILDFELQLQSRSNFILKNLILMTFINLILNLIFQD